MSAIITGPDSDALGRDGIRRYRTTCKVIIDSHNSGRLDVSSEVLSIAASKTVQGMGQAKLSLTPRANYLNHIQPNDYINIYFNIGDGASWTRTFFGFVDRSEEAYKVDKNGVPQTLYNIYCSDFQKGFDKTQIYFNNQMALRSDFSGEAFGGINVGGLALFTKGIEHFGSPVDVVRSMYLMILGYGSQFILPHTYNISSGVATSLRANREEYLRGRLSKNANAAILAEKDLAGLRAKIEAEVDGIVSEANGLEKQEEVLALLQKNGIAPAEVTSGQIDFRDPRRAGQFRKILYQRRLQKTLDAEIGGKGQPLDALLVGALEQLSSPSASLLDVVDLFNFMEYDAIDGWTTSTGIFQGQGGLGSIAKSWSNHAVNELFYDLRPRIVDEDDGLASAGNLYSREPDDIEGNLAEDGTEGGIQLIPSVIMREFPFGTIPAIDGIDIKLSLKTTEGNATLGSIPIGALFSDGPSVPGRQQISFPVIAHSSRAEGANYHTVKKLDVAVIDSTEIISHNFSRSDQLHINLFEVEAVDFIQSDYKFHVSDIIPMLSPIHVMRNGLRVKKAVSAYARLTREIVAGTENSLAAGVTPDAIAAEPAKAPVGTLESNFDLTQVEPGSVVTPIALDPDVSRNGRVFSAYGYRHRTGGEYWIFHNGVDIFGTKGKTEVRSVMDGLVVASMPNGTRGNGHYGETIIIQSIDPNGNPVYIQYSHLMKRFVGPPDNLALNNDLTKWIPKEGVSSNALTAGGTMKPIAVKKGEVIGLVGVTQGPKKDFYDNNAHLHFEILTGVDAPQIHPSKDLAATPYVKFGSAEAEEKGITRGSGTNPRSVNPEVYMEAFGAALPTTGRKLTKKDEVDDEAGDDDKSTAPVGTVDTDAAPVGSVVDADLAAAAATARSVALVGTADEAMFRRQLIRWTLLQDHWFQHNNEYLSGTIEMRGAPEIRVGYRLDIKDKNLSFYVEGVNHSWSFPNRMSTMLKVTRGQPNNPFPMYVTPAAPVFAEGNEGGQRMQESRLGVMFLTPDPMAVPRGVAFRGGSFDTSDKSTTLTGANDIDNPDVSLPTSFMAFTPKGPLPPVGTPTTPGGKTSVFRLDTQYNEFVIDASIETEAPGLTLGLPDNIASLGATLGIDLESFV